jgi:hypothetical protein
MRITAIDTYIAGNPWKNWLTVFQERHRREYRSEKTGRTPLT